MYGYVKKANVSESYQVLAAIMNSHLLWWYLKKTGTVLANGYFRYKPAYILPFPLPQNISLEIQNKLEVLVSDLTNRKKTITEAEVLSTETEINQIIYELYNLNELEIEQIHSH